MKEVEQNFERLRDLAARSVGDLRETAASLLELVGPLIGLCLRSDRPASLALGQESPAAEVERGDLVRGAGSLQSGR